ncbi:MAG: site-specific integrase [Blastocatellia bacterium]
MAIEETKDATGKTIYKADFSVTINGRRKRIRKLLPTKTDARNYERATKTDALRGTLKLKSEEPRRTFRQLKDDFIAHKATEVEKQSLAIYNATLARFLEQVGPKRRIDHVEMADLSAYLKARLAADISTPRINHELHAIMAALEYAPTCYKELRDWRAPHIKRLRDKFEGRKRVLTIEESEALLTHLQSINPDVADVFFIGTRTGARLQEIMKLQWADIIWDASSEGFEHGLTVLHATKTKSLRPIPMTEAIRSVFERRRESSKSIWVFPSPMNPKKPRYDIRKTLRAACKLAGIIYGRDIEGGMVFHDVRRTAVTNARKGRVDIETASAYFGHSIKVMLSIYSQTDPERQSAAAAVLDSAGPRMHQSGNGQSAKCPTEVSTSGTAEASGTTGTPGTKEKSA